LNLGPWDIIILQPMINVLLAISHVLFNNFGLTIIALTLIIRFILLPLTLKQLHSTKAMSDLQPRLLELQKKYAKDKQKLAQEQMLLYKESGINPVGCAVPMIIQFPIWIALYQAIILSLAVNPEALLNLSRYFYSWAVPLAELPLNNYFLGLNLANPNAIIAIFVGVTMWIQQKMVTPAVQDPRQAQQTQMMLWLMPIMFTFFSLSFPSGLALYWVVSNIFSIIVQYYVTGWGGLNFKFGRSSPSVGAGSARDQKLKKRLALESEQKKETAKPSQDSTHKEGSVDGKSGDKREDSGGSDQKGSGSIKRWFGGG
jgi:YidC/Oxa1 family membrane protein insertase